MPDLRRVALEDLAEALAEVRAALVVEREFARRQQAHVRHRVDGALGIDVEGLDALDLVVEQVEPVRHRRPHREEVDQPAADRVFARRHHLRHVGVAGQRHLVAELLGIEPFALPEGEGVGGEEGGRRQPADRGRRRHQQDVQFAAHRRPQAWRGARRRDPGAARNGRRAAFPSPAAGARAAPARTTGSRRAAAARPPRSPSPPPVAARRHARRSPPAPARRTTRPASAGRHACWPGAGRGGKGAGWGRTRMRGDGEARAAL